jgi:hypothetical protein
MGATHTRLLCQTPSNATLLRTLDARLHLLAFASISLREWYIPHKSRFLLYTSLRQLDRFFSTEGAHCGDDYMWRTDRDEEDGGHDRFSNAVFHLPIETKEHNDERAVTAGLPA